MSVPASTLDALRVHISTLRLRAKAAKTLGGNVSQTDIKFAPVFDSDLVFSDSLSADSDATNRSKKLIANLKKTGPLRILGAVAGPELAEQIAGLYETHSNFSPAIDYILGEEILARQHGGAITGLRLLLSGSAGVGKTDFSMTLAKILGLPCEAIGLSSSQAAATLGGSEEYWGNTKPGCVFTNLIMGTHANGLYVLDEIDKTCTNWGDPLGALYQLLEIKTSSVFSDKSFPWLPVNASLCNWIATANDTASMHPAMLSRFVEVKIGMPSSEALRSIVGRLYSDLLVEFAATGKFPDELTQRQTDVLLGLSIRDAKKIIRSALATALRTGCGEIELQSNIHTESLTSRRIGF